MSVVQSKRSESLLSVVLKAEDLCVWTLRLCSNEKHFPKRYRWCFTQHIVNDTIKLCQSISQANYIKVNTKDDWNRRKALQTDASIAAATILLDINIAFKMFDIESKTIKHWSNQVSDVIRLLNAWKRSDHKRYSELE